HRGRSVVKASHCGPLRVQKAFDPEAADDIAHVVVVHPPGGIAGGDSLELAFAVQTNAHLLATTPGATKWYRASGKGASQQLRLEVASKATLEWLPQETIVYDGALAANGIELELAPDAVALGWDVLCFGRTLAGESFTHGEYRQRIRISIATRLGWI